MVAISMIIDGFFAEGFVESAINDQIKMYCECESHINFFIAGQMLMADSIPYWSHEPIYLVRIAYNMIIVYDRRRMQITHLCFLVFFQFCFVLMLKSYLVLNALFIINLNFMPYTQKSNNILDSDWLLSH